MFTLDVIFALDYFCDFLDAKETIKIGVKIVHNVCDLQFKITKPKERILRNEFIKLLKFCKIHYKKKDEYECKLYLAMFVESLIRFHLLDFYPKHHIEVKQVTNEFPSIKASKEYASLHIIVWSELPRILHFFLKLYFAFFSAPSSFWILGRAYSYRENYVLSRSKKN